MARIFTIQAGMPRVIRLYQETGSEMRTARRAGRNPAMRRVAILLVSLIALIASSCAASAGVLVQIDKASQRMLVSVDGQPAYLWPVSTGRGGFGTPTGRFRPQWMARHWFSTRYYGSPMPHAIFFHKGYAIHGTNYISRLGGPASHGCVRLHPGNARTLFMLVQRYGMASTAIAVFGANPGTLAKRRARSAQVY
jgi:hypothetical protein